MRATAFRRSDTSDPRTPPADRPRKSGAARTTLNGRTRVVFGLTITGNRSGRPGNLVGDTGFEPVTSSV
jgi:hypothetical protein